MALIKTLLLLALVHSVWPQLIPDLTRRGTTIAPTTRPPEPEISLEQRTLNARCAARCRSEVCYIPDDNDCRNFITCKRQNVTSYMANVMPCAFGTYWAGFQAQKKITCDLPKNVVCNIDYCSNQPVGFTKRRHLNRNRYSYHLEGGGGIEPQPQITIKSRSSTGNRKYNLLLTYAHSDGNCRMFWQCGDKGPEPFCCPRGETYSETNRSCQPDLYNTCREKCPIKQDSCMLGRTTEFFDDGNCRTFWDCENNRPHPVCCPEGQGYDIRRGGCVNNGCNEVCPDLYKTDRCNSPGVSSYELLDGLCRTYIQCDAERGDQRWCCPSQHIYSSQQGMCVPKNPLQQYPCADDCPLNYKEECPLKPSPANPSIFLMTVHGGVVEFPCAPGTIFSYSKCTCGDPTADFVDNACNMELDLLFDQQNGMKRFGSQKQTDIDMIGIPTAGPTLGQRTTTRFNGDLTYRALFFQQPLPNLYIKMFYLPENNTTSSKQVLLSNCMTTELGAPSFELSLQNNQVVMALVTDPMIAGPSNAIQPVVTAVNYQPGEWNNFRAVYDNNSVYILNEASNQANFDTQQLNGQISVAAEGLDVGGCAINRALYEGFVGSMGRLQFSKCLKQQWIDDFNEVVRTAFPNLQTAGATTGV